MQQSLLSSVLIDINSTGVSPSSTSVNTQVFQMCETSAICIQNRHPIYENNKSRDMETKRVFTYFTPKSSSLIIGMKP